MAVKQQAISATINMISLKEENHMINLEWAIAKIEQLFMIEKQKPTPLQLGRGEKLQRKLILMC